MCICDNVRRSHSVVEIAGGRVRVLVGIAATSDRVERGVERQPVLDRQVAPRLLGTLFERLRT